MTTLAGDPERHSGPPNPFLPQARTNPYRVYDELRETEPVHHSPFGVWLVTSHAEALTVLRAPHMVAAPPPGASQWQAHRRAQQDASPLGRLLSHWMLLMDGPQHRALRAVAGVHLAERVVTSQAVPLRKLVHALIERLEPGSGVDVLAELAYALPVLLVGRILGLPESAQAPFLLLSRDIGAVVRPNPSPEVMQRGEVAAQAGIDLLADVAPHARAESLLCNLQGQARAGKLTDDEVFATCVMLMAAGHETTMHLIGNGILAIHQLGLRPTQEQLAVRKGTSPIVEELLRFDSPLQMVARVAATDCTLGGRAISAGEQVIVLLGAANRDPRVFATPGIVQIGRPGRHIAFGQGPHRCLGAALARFGSAALFEEFLHRFPDTAITAGTSPAWRESLALRGLKALLLDLPLTKENP